MSNDPEVTHRWMRVGDFDVTAKLYALPSNTLVGQAQGVARIGYFWGQFQLDSFTGGSSGDFGDPLAAAFVQFLAGVAAAPSYGQLSVSRSSDGDRDVMIYHAPPMGEAKSYWLVMDHGDMDDGTPDCPQSFTITDNRLTARWANPRYGFASGSLAGMCMAIDMTQTGSRIDGTYSLWAEYYHADSQNNPILVNQGQASYTFSSTYVKQ